MRRWEHLQTCFMIQELLISKPKQKQKWWGTSLVVQWLRLHAPNAGCLGSIPGQGTKIPYATTKTWYNKIYSFSSVQSLSRVRLFAIP